MAFFTASSLAYQSVRGRNEGEGVKNEVES
jgi:hypothetical protein